MYLFLLELMSSSCPIHNLQIFGLDHYAMHPSLNNSAYCTCALNFMPTTTHADPRLERNVNGLHSTSQIGWPSIMAYATPEECVGTYAQLCFAFEPAARKNWTVFLLRKKMVMAYLTPVERLSFSLVSSDAKVGASALKRSAFFCSLWVVLGM